MTTRTSSGETLRISAAHARRSVPSWRTSLATDVTGQRPRFTSKAVAISRSRAWAFTAALDDAVLVVIVVHVLVRLIQERPQPVRIRAAEYGRGEHQIQLPDGQLHVTIADGARITGTLQHIGGNVTVSPTQTSSDGPPSTSSARSSAPPNVSFPSRC